jgi:hypothetical protein
LSVDGTINPKEDEISDPEVLLLDSLLLHEVKRSKGLFLRMRMRMRVVVVIVAVIAIELCTDTLGRC